MIWVALYVFAIGAAFILGWTVRSLPKAPQKHFQADEVVIRLGDSFIVIEADGRTFLTVTSRKEMTFLDA